MPPCCPHSHWGHEGLQPCPPEPIPIPALLVLALSPGNQGGEQPVPASPACLALELFTQFWHEIAAQGKTKGFQC